MAPSIVESFLHTGDGVPWVDWPAFRECVGGSMPPDKQQATWCEAQLALLDAYAEFLGGDYKVLNGPRFLILCAGSTDDANALHRLCEHSLDEALRQLEGIGEDRRFGKHTVILFSAHEEYYSHFAVFDQGEGVSGTSGGCFINMPCMPHIALPGDRLGVDGGIIAHELTHALLQHLPIPAWLNEALAQRVQSAAFPGSARPLYARHITEHRRYWRRRGLRDFWRGACFNEHRRGQRLSYQLAEMLLQIAVERFSARTRAFVIDARWEDAGEASARRHLGVSLADLAEPVLGPGDWAVPDQLDARAPAMNEEWMAPVVPPEPRRLGIADRLRRLLCRGRP